ncbi:hypothetical protein GCM10010198_78350 [Nocardia seriolae]|uniref:hypothetical protein n=1 Tax=Nocardia seriolae TaxID=37332 RepID=UPI0031D25462
MVHTYYQTYLGGHTLKPNPDIYKAMMADIDAVTQRNYVAAVTGFGIDLQNYPSPEFQRWLLSVGANLEQWKKFRGYTDTGGSACYVVVGKQGTAPGHAIEMLQAVYSPSNWMQEPYLFNMNPSALALTYGRTAQKRAGTHSYGSLLPRQRPSQTPNPRRSTNPPITPPERTGRPHHDRCTLNANRRAIMPMTVHRVQPIARRSRVR